ncbi:MAG: hypothetical protein IJS13_02405 [Paludibacteraceae bacterium]|nr:hypothetical protein [Paludibacteraceae bacterium]
MKRVLNTLALLTIVLSVSAQLLLTEGTVVYHEDFGGNDPSDPRISTTPVPGMSHQYSQLTNDVFLSMYSGAYLVTKSGYCNGDTAVGSQWRGAQWHIQDDHTYPGDYTRGYLLEIDGRGGNAPFYSTTINGLTPGSALSFYAYVANVMTWYHTNVRYNAAKPNLRFVISDNDDNVIASYTTGPIDSDTISKVVTPLPNARGWNVSSKWHQVGFTFKLPDGLTDIKLTIYNYVYDYGAGNDFAIDDIYLVDATISYEDIKQYEGKTIVGKDSVCLGSTWFYEDVISTNPNITIKIKH